MFFVYILYSQDYDRYYIGSTDDTRKRLERHNSGQNKSTKPFRPWVLVYQEQFDTRSEARKRENQIKRYKGGKAFHKLLFIRAGTQVVNEGRL